ncbi:MAG: lipopolysaccharide biosynthesis protein, partial [Nitrospiraceae bacterium]
MSALSSQPGRHLLDGSIRVLLAEALFPLTALMTAAILTRRLGPEGYGLLVLTATLVAWVEWTINSMFSRAIITFVGQAKDWRPVGSNLVRLHLAISGLAMVAVWLLA